MENDVIRRMMIERPDYIGKISHHIDKKIGIVAGTIQ